MVSHSGISRSFIYFIVKVVECGRWYEWNKLLEVPQRIASIEMATCLDDSDGVGSCFWGDDD